jgi:large subunit ribosomal protein L28
MSNTCDVCGKGPQYGQHIRHQHSGSWELKAPRTKKKWLPNLQTVHVAQINGTKALKVCTKCIKAGKVTRAI